MNADKIWEDKMSREIASNARIVTTMSPVSKLTGNEFSSEVPATLQEKITVAAPITIRNEKFYMGVMVQRDIQSNRVYLHDVITEKATLSFNTEPTANKGEGIRDNGHLFITSILQNALKVNTYGETSLQKFPSPEEAKRLSKGNDGKFSREFTPQIAERSFDKLVEGKKTNEVSYGRQDIDFDAVAKSRKSNRSHGKASREIEAEYSDYNKPITISDIETLRSIGRKSINNFTDEDIAVEEFYQDWKHPNNKRFHNLRYVQKIADIPTKKVAKNPEGRQDYKESRAVSFVENLATTYSIIDLYEFVNRIEEKRSHGFTTEVQSPIVWSPASRWLRS